MKTHSISRLLLAVAVAAATLCTSSCGEDKFVVRGTITEAKDSVLYFENMSLTGPVAIDSARLGETGEFVFKGRRNAAPEFYRLRIAEQIINVAVDSTETISIKASYPDMAAGYSVEGSDDCTRIRELSLMLMHLQSRINQIVTDPELSMEVAADSVETVVEQYKDTVKLEYIFKEPMKASSYFAVFQTVIVGRVQALIFNPRSNEDDVKVYAAVATSWDAFYPNAERGLNLHNIAIEGMKNIRIMKNKMAQTLNPDVVDTSGIIDIVLGDNKGNKQRLSMLKGNVVLLDFHYFAGDGSRDRIMTLRDVYDKYKDRGFEIYQVAIDTDEHFWKLQTAALPWISVRVGDSAETVLRKYNVQTIPTFFLLDKDINVAKRDMQIDDLDAEIEKLLRQ